jgi:hypothetical protein
VVFSKSMVIFLMMLVIISLIIVQGILVDRKAFFTLLTIELVVLTVSIRIGWSYEPNRLQSNRLQESLISEINRAVGHLSQMHILKLADPAKLFFESQNMKRFCQQFLRTLTKRFNYDSGFFEITDPSLPYSFFNWYTTRRGQGPPISLVNAIRLVALKSRGKAVSAEEQEITKLFKENGVPLAEFNLSYKRIAIVPVAHNEKEIFGYFALVGNRGRTPLLKLKPFGYSESVLLTDIVNMKIVHPMKFFIERQRLWLAIGLMRILDFEVFEKIITRRINDFLDCGRRIVKILTDKLKLPVGFIYLRSDVLTPEHGDENPYIYLTSGERDIGDEIKQQFLMPLISDKSDKWSKGPVMEAVANVVHPTSFDLSFYLACPIASASREYGMIGFMARRQFTDFDIELIRIVENFKIDDCFSTIDRLKQQTPALHL